MRLNHLIVVLAMVVLAVVVLDYGPFHDPTMSDGAGFPMMARVIAGQITNPRFIAHGGSMIPHPPLYQMSLALVALIFGGDLVYFRLFTILCGVISCVLMSRIIKAIVDEQLTRNLATLLAVSTYLMNPFGRLGMLQTDNDFTVIAPALLLGCYLTILYAQKPDTRRLLYLICGQALAFWTKLTSSFVFPFVIAAHLVRRGRRRSFFTAAVAFTGGITLFMMTWWIFSVVADYPFWHPMIRIIGVFQEKAAFVENKGLMIGRTGLGSLFWFGPSFLALALTAGILILRAPETDRMTRDLTACAAYGGTLFCVYLYIGGISYGSPKYQYPSVALLSVPVGVMLGRRLSGLRIRWGWVALLFGLAVAFQCSMGDPLYRLFIGLRRDVYQTGRSSPAVYLRAVGADILLVLIPLAVCAVVALRAGATRRLNIWLVSLTVTMFAYNVGLGIRQSRADYNTTYNYGARGAQQVLDAMRPGSRVLVPEFGIYGLFNADRLTFVDLPPSEINAAGQELVDQIGKADPDYAVMGLALNTLDQLFRYDEDDTLQKYLQSHFSQRPIGDFILYERRN